MNPFHFYLFHCSEERQAPSFQFSAVATSAKVSLSSKWCCFVVYEMFLAIIHTLYIRSYPSMSTASFMYIEKCEWKTPAIKRKGTIASLVTIHCTFVSCALLSSMCSVN